MRYARLTPPAVLGGGAPTPWILGDDSLARGPGSRFIVAGWPGMEILVQPLPYINSAYQGNLPRYTRDVSFTLVCEYEFADESSSFLFTCRFPEECPLYGVLEMGVVGSGGGKIIYPSAIIKRVLPVNGQSDPQVVSTRIQYDIVAGKPTLGGAQ